MIVFHHIPKTAGTTFNSVIDGYYANRFIIETDRIQTIKEDYYAFVKNHGQPEMVRGHLLPHLLKDLDQDVRKIIFLRNPLEQVQSTFRYIKNATWNKWHNEVSKMKSIEEFINHRQEYKLDNLQLRHIIGDTHFLINGKESSLELTNDHLIHGKQILENAEFTFLTERFDDSLIILKDYLGWKSLPYYRRKNISQAANRNELNDKTGRKLEEAFSFDISLYEHATLLFHSRYNEFLQKKSVEVNRFKRMNKLRNSLRVR